MRRVEPEQLYPVRDEELREFAHLGSRIQKGKDELTVIRESNGKLAFIEKKTKKVNRP